MWDAPGSAALWVKATFKGIKRAQSGIRYEKVACGLAGVSYGVCIIIITVITACRCSEARALRLCARFCKLPSRVQGSDLADLAQGCA